MSNTNSNSELSHPVSADSAADGELREAELDGVSGGHPVLGFLLAYGAGKLLDKAVEGPSFLETVYKKATS